MEEIVTNVVKDLPSTAVLILFLWFTSKQFQQAITLISDHLKEINRILEMCIKSAELTEREKEMERKIDHFMAGMLSAEHKKQDDSRDRRDRRARRKQDFKD